MIARLLSVSALSLVMLAQTRTPTQSPATYRIAGTVVSSLTEQPLAGVKASVVATENRELRREVSTGADGSFAFAGLPPGKYSLTASANGYSEQGLNQHGDYFTGIVVGPDLDTKRLVFRLIPDGLIEGIVTDEDGEAVRNASVTLFARDNETGRQRTQQVYNTAADDRGHYNFGHRPPGTYYVAVSARPWYAQYQGSSSNEPPADPGNAARVAEEKARLDVAYPMTFFPSAEDSSSAGAITVHPGERVTANVALRAVPAVHLRVTTAAGGEKNANYLARGFPRVSQRIFDGLIVPVMSAQAVGYNSGAFEYTGIAPGHYIIEMPDPGLKRQGGGWYKEIDLSGTVELDARESPALASVTGTLVLEGGAAPSGRIYVLLANRTTGENFSAEVTPQGTFDFSDTGVRPGTYDVMLNNAPRFLVKSLLAKGARVAGETVEISGGDVQLVINATHSIARIDGLVLNQDKPYAGAMVVLVPRDPATNLTLFRLDQSDSDGTFTLRGVLPGAYTVIALENAWNLDWGNPAVLRPFLKNGASVDVTGEGKLNVKVQLQ